ncbi:ABC transporter permease [Ilyomonas limi]|uniref:ABC transporter permease n=1 Tax=Ilyomonas limi TaxID=2575867 RepID=A0A4U3L264_9BACT|nr:ABC transporter permease [Ilyomonas limi]TKK68942.1 ABC transporter permease [Ilyomonas limi]
MNKTSLIIQREYISRVRNKTFIITTILMPLLFVLLIAGSTYLSIKGKENLNIAVIDNSGYFKDNLENSSNIAFSFPAGVDTNNYISKGYSAILIMPQSTGNNGNNYLLRSKKSIGIGSKETIENKIDAAIETKMLQDAGIQKSQLDSIHSQSQDATLSTVEEGDNNSTRESNQWLAYGIGYGSGFLIYLTMLIYGMMVLRGVMEEKTNRIAEVIVSSVKPFQLMMGKIIGIGAVGLTQFLIWIVFIFLIMFGVHLFVSPETMQQVQAMQQSGTMPGAASSINASQSAQTIYNIQHMADTVNWGLIVGCFIFYFLGGYLFYASLFAAIGSVVEDVQNSQSLTLPITMPIIFSFIVMANAVQNPDSGLAVWCSFIPFSSPMVMMARIAYGVPGTVPYWQLIVSMLMLVAGFLFTTWLAGKIYRTGILLYGKKPTWAQMMKWAFRRA